MAEERRATGGGAPSRTGGEELLALVEMMRRLRAECAWKAEQTHLTLAKHLLEETYELIEAIESGDDTHLREELGDVLLQVLFHAAIAEQEQRFGLDDVAAGLARKLRARNPHVFGSPADRETDPERINERWEQVKAAEKQRDDPLDGVPPALPALARASKVLDRLERAGIEVHRDESTLGGRLLALVAEARAAGLDPEQELRVVVRRLGGS